MEDINRYFEILGLKPGASLEEVKEAYRDLVKVWHPDRFAHDPKLQQKAQEKLKEINEAFQKVQDFLINLHKYQQATEANKNDSGESTGSTSQPGETTESEKVEPENTTEPNNSQNVDNLKKPWKAFSWKALLGALFIAFILHVGAAMAMDSKPKNFVGTAMWIYLTIVAWKYWGWKSLIPYPAYAVCIFFLSAILVSFGVERVSILFVTWAMHIGGLIIFYVLLKKSAEDMSKKSRNIAAWVFGIIGLCIIAAIVIPYYAGVQERARTSQNEQTPAQLKQESGLGDDYKASSAPTAAPYGYDMVPGKEWVPAQAPDTTTPKQPSSNLTELYNNRGNDHYSNGQYSLAIENYSKAIAINPNDSTLLLNRGNAYLLGGQRNNAILDFKKACKMGYEPSCNTLKSVLEIRQQETSSGDGQVAVSTPLKPVALPPAQSPIKLTVKDEVSGLIWLWNANLSGKPMDWESANYFVQQLNEKRYAGYNDWRLPTADELKTLSKNIQRYRLDFQNVQKNYWSATSSIGHKDTLANVDIGDGYVWYTSIVNKTYVWPVRDSQKTVQN